MDSGDLYAALHMIPWFNSLTPEHFNKTAELTHLRHAKAGEIFSGKAISRIMFTSSWMDGFPWIFSFLTTARFAF